MAADPSNEPEPRPRLMVASAALGGVGVVLLLLGALLSVDALFFAGMVAGALSLAVALAWRAELISAWRSRPGRPPG